MRFPSLGAARTAIVTTSVALLGVVYGCESRTADAAAQAEMTSVEVEVEAAVWSFHAATTAMDAEKVVDLFSPDFDMLVDGQRMDYAQVAQGSRDFMTSLEEFHTVWSDLQIIALAPDAAISSFIFRDSILTRSGELIESRGPTTLLWERRDGAWRMRFADADHYPINP